MPKAETEQFWTRAQRIEADKQAARHAALYENFRAQFPGAPCELLTQGQEEPCLRLGFGTLDVRIVDGPRRASEGHRWTLWYGTTQKSLSMLADCGDLFRLCADWEAEIARAGGPPGRRLKTRHQVSFSPVAAHLVGRLKPTGEGIRRWYGMVMAWLTGRARVRPVGDA